MAKLKLNRTGIERILPQSGKQITVWDSDITGFGLRVSSGGAKTFFFQGRLDGMVKKYTIGRFGHLTPEQARKEAKRMQATLELGQEPKPGKSKAGGHSFGDMMLAYVDLLEAQGKESARDVKNQIAKHIEKPFPRLWKKPANQIDLDDCIQIVSALRDAGKPRQADKVRSYIRTAFSEAINSRGDVNAPATMRRLNIKFNPARDIRKVKGSSNANERALTLSEFRAYWRHIHALPEPHKSLAIFHTLTGGQRQRQLARATIADIDRDGRRLTLWDGKGRREKPRQHIVPLLPEALEAIDRITGGGDYIFSCNGGQSPVHVRFMNDLLKRINANMAQSGELEGGKFTPGSIRATVETRLAAKPWSVSGDVLAQLLSHGLGGVQNKHYQKHKFFEEKLEALQKLQRMLESETGGNVVELGRVRT